MASSLLLDTVTWDLCVDASGNIAVCTEPYSDAQDAACAMRLFSGEMFFDTSQGVPYWAKILGQWPPVSLLKAELTFAALSATNVVSAVVYVTSWKNRTVGGVVVVTNSAGQQAASFYNSALGNQSP